MPVVERVSRIRITDTASGAWREWSLSVPSRDVTPGVPVTVTYSQTTQGAVPPGEPDGARTLQFRVDNGSTVAEGITLGPPTQFNQVATTYTFTPTRTGTLRGYIRMVRTGIGAYDVNSDNSPASTLPAGTTGTYDQGWWRVNTTLTVRASNVAAGGAKTLPFSFGDTIHTRTTLGAEPYASSLSLFLRIGANPAIAEDFTAASATTDRTHGTVDNRFNATRAERAFNIAPRNAALTGLPAMVPTTTTDDVADLDPRLTATRLFQLNDNTFGTPPLLKNNASGARLTSDLAFVGARLTNARGEGVNAIALTGQVQDEKGLVSAISRATTTQNQGGEAGWAATFLVWDSQLPGGNWTHTTTLTSPSATGLMSNPTHTYALLAPNPSITLVTAGGPTVKAKHWSAGMTFQMGIAAINTLGQALVAADSATAALVRLQDTGANIGRSEFLDSDMVWKRITTADTIYFWPLSESIAGVSRVYIRNFTDTALWGDYDLFVVGKAVIGGTPYGTQAKEIGVGASNDHAGYALDPLALATSGILSAR